MNLEITTATLLASPVVPNARGVGVEQRAARTLAALSPAGPVDVVWCRPRWAGYVPGRARPAPPPGCRALTTHPRLDPLPGELVLRHAALRWPRSSGLAQLERLVDQALPLPRPALAHASSTRRYHAFRLAAASAIPTRRDGARADLDLDDLESETARAIAELAAKVGDRAVAALYAALARRLTALERALLPRFDRVYVGSALDARTLASTTTHSLDIRVLPNVIDVPAAPRVRPRRPGPTRFLFIGALGYYPNIDALRLLTERVLPRVRAMRRAPFELHVIGRGAPPWLEAGLRSTRGVVYHGPVADLAPHYAGADAVVAPLRAGGGTRIKLLEAFAWEVPVISTHVGAFGLDVEDGRHLLLADDDEALANACVRFIDDPAAFSELTRHARSHAAEHHHPAAFARALAT